MTNLEAARKYASRGWPVFPLTPRDKVPLKESHGFLDATVLGSQIARWWQADPNYNVGISCGPAGLCVVDIDPKNDGLESLKRLEQTHGALDAPVVLTGSGGEHYYFKTTPGVAIQSGQNVFGDAFPGIDIRSAGGYVVAPPSIHPNGRPYTWAADNPRNIPDLPAWIASTIQGRKVVPIRGLEEDIPEGERDLQLYRLACRMRAHGWSYQDILSALTIRNQKLSRPLPAHIIEQKAKSACKHEPGGKGPGGVPGAFNAGVRDEESAPRVTRASEILREDVSYIWEGRIPRGEVSLIVGEPEVGKTFGYLSIAASISRNAPLPGSSQELSGEVLIYAGEDSEGVIRDRLESLDANLERIHVLGSFSADDLDFLDSYLEQHEAIVWVVIDPISAVVGSRDEASDAQVRQVIRPLRAIAQKHGVGVTGLRHLTKNRETPVQNRVLGGIAWIAVPRSVLYFEEHKKTRKRAVFHLKSNLPGGKCDPVEYVIGPDGLRFVGESEDFDITEFSMSRPEIGRPPVKAGEAAEWLRSLLLDGPMPVTEMLRLAKVNGFSQRTIERTRKELSVGAERLGKTTGPWFCWLPPRHNARIFGGLLDPDRQNSWGHTAIHTANQTANETSGGVGRPPEVSDLMAYAKAKLA